MSGDRLPTGLMVDAALQNLTMQGKSFYYIQKGNHSSGIIMLKLSDMRGMCKLIMQQRNFMTNEMEWIDALGKEEIEEAEADAYIRRSVENDPDLWVIEIEGEAKANPFEESE